MVVLRRLVDYSISLFIISLLSLSSPLLSSPHPLSNINDSPDIHDILPIYNIPKGIVPGDVKSYSFSSKDGSFTVEMEHTCYVKFADDQLVYYDKIIKGKLTYGKISQVSGIQAKKFFIWVPVTGLDVDSDAGVVEFHVGALSKKFPAEQFVEIPTCIKNMACSNGFSLRLKSLWANYYYF